MPINSLENYQKKVIIILLLIALILAVFWQVQNHEFINYDDNLYVTQNYLTQSGLTGRAIIIAFTDTQTGNWHPLTMLSHMLDWELFGNNAGGHHWTSVIIHIINVILFFLLIYKYFKHISKKKETPLKEFLFIILFLFFFY